jgi:hypothetical protein
MEAGFKEVAKVGGGRVGTPLPSSPPSESNSNHLQQDCFVFFKVKKTVTYPTTQTCIALAAFDMCAE